MHLTHIKSNISGAILSLFFIKIILKCLFNLLKTCYHVGYWKILYLDKYCVESQEYLLKKILKLSKIALGSSFFLSRFCLKDRGWPSAINIKKLRSQQLSNFLNIGSDAKYQCISSWIYFQLSMCLYVFFSFLSRFRNPVFTIWICYRYRLHLCKKKQVLPFKDILASFNHYSLKNSVLKSG